MKSAGGNGIDCRAGGGGLGLGTWLAYLGQKEMKSGGKR